MTSEDVMKMMEQPEYSGSYQIPSVSNNTSQPTMEYTPQINHQSYTEQSQHAQNVQNSSHNSQAQENTNIFTQQNNVQSIQQLSNEDTNMVMSNELPINQPNRVKRPRPVPRPLNINYSIAQDVMKQKANIEIGDLVAAAPSLRRALIKACRPVRDPRSAATVTPTLAYIEDGDVDTTAVYADFTINNVKIRTLIDCGAAKTCMSYDLAVQLGMAIDAKSTSVFLMGNGTKQPAIGLIYDVPICAGGIITIPGIIEVLPKTPTKLIIGNNWLNRAKAKIAFETKSLNVSYKGRTANIPINFIRENPAHVVKIDAIKTPANNILTTELEETSESEYSSTSDDDFYTEVSMSDSLTDDSDVSELFNINVQEYIKVEDSIEMISHDMYNIDLDPTQYTLNTESVPYKDYLTEEQLSKVQIEEIEDKDIHERAIQLIAAYQDVFDWNNDTLGCTNLLTHRIITEDVPPIRSRPYRISPLEAGALKTEIDKLHKLGVIKPSNSPWSSPIILLKKKDNSYRLVIDYRKLNSITKKDAYAIPRIETLLDTLGKASVFSALDMRSGFYQVELDEDSREKSAFSTAQYGQWEYIRMPMGLCNSVGTFQRMVDLVFKSLINKCLVAYIDDLNCYSNEHEEHLHHLEQVFKCVRAANLKLNIEKCYFFKKRINFLGYIISDKGLEADPKKVEKIRDFPIPKTLKQVRSFIGIASYYRRFINGFAAIARPLHNLTKTKNPGIWDESAIKAFEGLKSALTNTPVLIRPDFDKEFIIITDASGKGLGAICSQLDENGHEHPIQYASRGLKSSEVKYGVSKLECLAVIWAINLFRPYLLGKHFTIITDHSALRGLLKTPNPTGIIARWITVISEYDFEIKYRPGRVNESADFLSRLGY